jgi:hypothetical protein
MRILQSPAFWVLLSVSFIAIFANLGGVAFQGNATLASDRVPLAQMTKMESLSREGTVLTDVKGGFRKQGERRLFVEEGTTKSIKCLENLCLQRVVANQQDDDPKVVWLVSAKLTEFNNENFLILDKAVRSR